MSSMNIPTRPHRSEAAALPKGWIREEVPRSAGGISSRKSDVYYISPSGKKIRSKPELLKILGEHYDLSTFDYFTGKMNSALATTNGKSSSSGGGAKSKSNGQAANNNKQYDFTKSLRNDANLVPPIRQTASIFKQPVTVHKQSAENKVKVDKTTTSEKPRQLYWEKRLSGLRPSYPKESFEPFELPKNFKPIGPGVVDDIALASITTSLHMNSGAIVGQKTSKFKPNADPALFINPEQPLIAATTISNEDIEKQEQKVLEMRKKLAEAIEALSG